MLIPTACLRRAIGRACSRILDVSRLLQRGSIDSEKEEATGQRVAHPHCEKTELVTGVVHNLDVVAAIYLTVDVSGSKAMPSSIALQRAPRAMALSSRRTCAT